MEEGSLLPEALKQQQQQRQQQQQHESNDGSTLFTQDKNVLVIDVYSLKFVQGNDDKKEEDDSLVPQRLLHLAELATSCNKYWKQLSKNYRWHYGGDGPVFGIHVTTTDDDDGIEGTTGGGMPHLRAYVYYGPNVIDEWIAIYYAMELSKHVGNEIVISCWDIQDGQIILIQTSDVLPDYIDDDSTDNHRYACWIQDGHVRLITQPKHILLTDALVYLKNNKEKTPTQLDQTIQTSLESFLRSIVQQQFLHKTPLVVPRKVAYLIQNRPDLIHTCIQSLCTNIDAEELPTTDDTNDDYEDWVWMTCQVSKTNYAMLRTMVSLSPNMGTTWDTTDTIPPSFNRNIEIKRYKRLCANDATPHVKHALTLGIRFVIGLQYLLLQQKQQKASSSSLEQRIAYWTRIDTACRGMAASGDDSSWLLNSIQQGPNHSIYNLEHLLKCPVYPEECNNMTLLSYPETTMKQQLVQGQTKKKKQKTSKEKDNDDDEEFLLPKPDDVDDESWMDVLPSSSVVDDSEGNTTGNLDVMLQNFQNFMIQQSNIVDGVTTKATKATKEDQQQVRRVGEIRPRIFMNILHSVLKGTDELTFSKTEEEDPYFFKEDYDLMDDDNHDDEDDGNINSGEEDVAMTHLMNIMDAELIEKASVSRKLDGGEAINTAASPDDDDDDDDVAEGAHVLTNLLQSLEASSGTPGPVGNMLKEMGGTK